MPVQIQGIEKNRIKNDRKNFVVPALLSCEIQSRKIKNYTGYLNFSLTVYFIISKAGTSKKKSVILYSMFCSTNTTLLDTNSILLPYYLTSAPPFQGFHCQLPSTKLTGLKDLYSWYRAIHWRQQDLPAFCNRKRERGIVISIIYFFD